MKKMFLMAILILSVVAAFNGVEYDDLIFYNEYGKDIIGHGIDMDSVKKNLINDYIKSYVPKDFSQNFIDFTDKFDSTDSNFKLCALAIADVESVKWTVFSSVKPNKDGSIDVGPMGLNSNNIKHKWFLKKYLDNNVNYKSDNHKWMNICINWLHEIYVHYGMNRALLVYNGGRGALSCKSNSSRFKMTRLYQKYVLSRYKYHKSKIEKIINTKLNSLVENTKKDRFIAYLVKRHKDAIERRSNIGFSDCYLIKLSIIKYFLDNKQVLYEVLLKA